MTKVHYVADYERRHGMKKDKIINAITIGISAMMAMNSSMVAFAEGDEAALENTPSENIEEAAPAAPTEVQEAGQQVEQQAQETVSAIDDAVSNADAMMTELTETVDAEDGGTIAEPYIEALAAEVEEASNDQIVEDIQETTSAIEEVVAEVEVAVEQSEIVQETATQAVEAVDDIVTTADNMTGLVEDTEEKAEELIQTIENTEDPDEAIETYSELQELVVQTQETVELQQQHIEEMTEKYTDAKQKLLDAEQKYETAIQNAEDNIDEVAEQLELAQQEVAEIESALVDAQEKLEYEQKAAETLNNAQLKNNWESQRAYMKLLVVNYIIPQMEGEEIDPNSVVIDRPDGFDTQDCNYYTFTYTDSNGDQVTRYFNYDRVDKKLSSNRYGNLGSSAQIVVFEKELDEILANDYLFEYYEGVTFTRNELTSKANKGDFAVFVYTDEDNNKTFMVKEELDAAIANGDIVKTENGTYELADGTPVTEVVQNANSKVHGGEYTIDISNAPDLDTFLENADATYQQYVALTSVVSDTKEAVEDAQGEVEKLGDAIGTLKNKHGNPVLKAVDALGVSDVATYLGITVTQEQADLLNTMTVQQAVEYLDALLATANAQVENATATLDALNTKLDEIGQNLGVEDGEANVAYEGEDEQPADEVEPAVGEVPAASAAPEEEVTQADPTAPTEEVAQADPTAPTEEVAQADPIASTEVAVLTDTVTIEDSEVALVSEVDSIQSAFEEITAQDLVASNAGIIDLEVLPNTGATQNTGIVTPMILTGDGAAVQTFGNTDPVSIGDGEVALVSEIDTLQNVPVQPKEDNTAAEISDQAVPRASKAIEDDEASKAATPYTENKDNENNFWWWWLLIIAALTGAKKYADRVNEYNDNLNNK